MFSAIEFFKSEETFPSSPKGFMKDDDIICQVGVMIAVLSLNLAKGESSILPDETLQKIQI